MLELNSTDLVFESTEGKVSHARLGLHRPGSRERSVAGVGLASNLKITIDLDVACSSSITVKCAVVFCRAERRAGESVVATLICPSNNRSVTSDYSTWLVL